MTFKQLLRRIFANLWYRCADIARNKINGTIIRDTEMLKFWEDFIVRCDQRAMKHAEFVPGKDHGDQTTISGGRSDG